MVMVNYARVPNGVKLQFSPNNLHFNTATLHGNIAVLLVIVLEYKYRLSHEGPYTGFVISKTQKMKLKLATLDSPICG